jgi:hypothetical protein
MVAAVDIRGQVKTSPMGIAPPPTITPIIDSNHVKLIDTAFKMQQNL